MQNRLKIGEEGNKNKLYMGNREGYGRRHTNCEDPKLLGVNICGHCVTKFSIKTILEAALYTAMFVR